MRNLVPRQHVRVLEFSLTFALKIRNLKREGLQMHSLDERDAEKVSRLHGILVS